MDLILAISCFVVAILAFMIGFVTEFRQSRKIGPYAIVPTLPWAVGAGLFVGFALLFLHIAWWIILLAFGGAVVVFGYAIIRASRRDSPKME
jgi:O-antigen/teichoic acid export membrane protein